MVRLRTRALPLGLSADVAFRSQIIEEQLAFPSGTATGQLISVLHEMPPPDLRGVVPRQRRGYNALASEEEGDREQDGIAHVAEPQERETDTLHVDQNAEEKEGWSALIWSFAASGAMTVCPFPFPSFQYEGDRNADLYIGKCDSSRRTFSR